MIKYKCKDCNRVVEVETESEMKGGLFGFGRMSLCSECDGEFEKLDEDYKEEEDDDEDKEIPIPKNYERKVSPIDEKEFE